MPTWPSPRSERLGTPKFPQSASRGASLSGLPGLLTLRPARLLAPLCRIEPVSRPQRAFTSRLPADWSPALPLNMTTTWTGLLVLAGLSPAGMAASLAAPDPYWRDLGNADRADRVSHRLALRRQDVDLAQLRHDLFGLVMLSRDCGPPPRPKTYFGVDHFNGGGSHPRRGMS